MILQETIDLDKEKEKQELMALYALINNPGWLVLKKEINLLSDNIHQELYFCDLIKVDQLRGRASGLRMVIEMVERAKDRYSSICDVS